MSTYAVPKFLWPIAAVLIFLGFRGTVSHSILAAIWFLPAVYLARKSRHAFLLAGVPMALYCLANGRNIATYDNYGAQLTAASLVMEGKSEISAWTGQQTDGKVDCTKQVRFPIFCDARGAFSATPLGIQLLAVPVFFVGRIVGADLRNHHTLWRLSKWTAAWAAAVCLTLFLFLARHLTDEKTARVVTLFVGAGSGLAAIVGQGIWSHTAVTTALMLALMGLLHFRSPWWIGLGWSWMFASRLTSATLIAPMALWLLWKQPALALRAGAVAALGCLPWGVWNWSLYGHVLGAQQVAAAGSEQTIFSLGFFPQGVFGLTFSPGTGFFIYQTWALLLFFLIRKESLQRFSWLSAFLGMFLAPLLLFACFFQWSGQHCWGTRYLTEAIPPMGLALAALLPRVNRLAWVLGSVAILIQINGIFLKGGEWQTHPLDPNQTMEQRSLDWGDPAFLYPLPRHLR